MRAPISVVIPTLNASGTLPSCLAALAEGLEAGLIRELIITDGGSTDETRAISDAAGAVWISGPASRGGQLKRGCAQAQGAWLFVVHADTVLSPGWTDAAHRALNKPEARYARLRFDDGGWAARWVAGWANVRARLFGLPYGDQTLLVARPLYDATGGYPDQPLMEDVALARALRGQLRAMDATAITSAKKYKAQGWLRRGSRNLWTLALYALGASPDDLARSYRR